MGDVDLALALRVISGWQRALGDSHPFGLTGSQLVDLAQSAVTALNTPEIWSVGDSIPGDVGIVEDGGGFEWERTDDDLPRWRVIRSPDLTEVALLESFGPVRAAREPAGPRWPDDDDEMRLDAEPGDLASYRGVLAALNLSAVALSKVVDARGRTVSAPVFRSARSAAAAVDEALDTLRDLAGEVTP